MPHVRLLKISPNRQTGSTLRDRLLPSAGWVKQAWDPTEEDLLSLFGLDVVVFMRIFVFSLKVFFIAAVIGIAVLLPINYMGTQVTDDSDLEYWHISDKIISCFYSSKPLPQQFTVLVHNIPTSPGISISEKVESFFTECYPSTYLTRTIVHKTRKLQRLDKDAEQLSKKLCPIEIKYKRSTQVPMQGPVWSHWPKS